MSVNPNDDAHTNMNMTLLDGTFFQLVPNKSTSRNIIATCIKCLPNNVEVKGYRNCTSNFVTHLKRKHGNDVVEEYKAYTKKKDIKQWIININTVRNINIKYIFTRKF